MGDTPQPTPQTAAPTTALEHAQPRQVTMYDETRSYFPALPPEDPLNRIWSFAVAVKGARFIKEEYRDDQKSIAFIALRGHEMGLPLTQALQSLYMTPDGKLGTQGDAMLALLLSKGFKVTFPIHTKEKAVCRIIRPGEGPEDAHEEEFTWEDASVIVTGYQWDKEKNRPDFSRPKVLTDKTNWKNYPKNMLMWRALSNCARFKATDVISGIYLMDEVEDNYDEAPPVGARPATEERPEGKYTVAPKAAPVVDATPVVATPVANATPEPPAAPAAKPNGAPAPEPPKPRAKKETDEGRVLYEIHVHRDGQVALTEEIPQASRQTAELRAQALANQTGLVHEVVSNAGGERVSKGKFYPPAKKDNVVEMPQGQTPAPVPPPPPAPDPTPAPPPAAAQAAGPVREKLLALVEAVTKDPASKGMPVKTAQARVQTFLVNYIGVNTAPELKKLPDEAYADALADLEALVAYDVNALLAEPGEAGKRLAASNAGFSQIWQQTKWKPDTCRLGRAFARRNSHTPDDFQKFIEGSQFGDRSLDFMEEEIVRAYFRVALQTREAGKLLKTCIGHNLDFLKAIHSIEERGTGCPIEQADPKVLEACIASFLAETKKEATKPAPVKKEAAPPPPPPPPPPPEEEPGGLFDED